MGDIIKKAMMPMLGAGQLAVGGATMNPALIASGAGTLGTGLTSDFAGAPSMPKLNLTPPSFSASPSIGGPTLPDIPVGAGGTGVSTFAPSGAGAGGMGMSADAIKEAIAQVMSQFTGSSGSDPFSSYGG